MIIGIDEADRFDDGLARTPRPRDELRATDMLGQEASLLVRASLADDGAHGLEWFEPGSVRFGRPNGSAGPVRVTAERLAGVTPGGHAIRLAGERRLTGELDRTTNLVDLAILVNPPDRQDSAKLALETRPATAEAPTPLPRSNRLALGRFDAVDGSLRIVPPPRRLGVLRNLERWPAYVDPLTTRLGHLARTATSADPGLDRLARSALASELGWLAFAWWRLTIPQLAERLRFVAWLRRWDAAAGRIHPGFDGEDDGMALDHGADSSAEGLPGRLAQLLDGAATVGPPEIDLQPGRHIELDSHGDVWRVRLIRDLGEGRLNIVRLADDHAPPELRLMAPIRHDAMPARVRRDRVSYRSEPLTLAAGDVFTLAPMTGGNDLWRIGFLR